MLVADNNDDNKPYKKIEKKETPKLIGNTGILVRDVTNKECHWLANTLKKGMIIWKYLGYDYGSITSNGVACILDIDSPSSFIELPKSAIIWD